MVKSIARGAVDDSMHSRHSALDRPQHRGAKDLTFVHRKHEIVALLLNRSINVPLLCEEAPVTYDVT